MFDSAAPSGLPNALALVVLSGQTRSLMDSYFERKPWL